MSVEMLELSTNDLIRKITKNALDVQRTTI
jgi:hypothetical protein